MKAFRFAVVVALVLSAAAVSAQRSNLRLGTILPANSIWDRSLKDMAAAWQEGTDGRVRMQVRGTTGDESTIIRRMRMNQPQVAALTLPGLAAVDEAFGVFGIPFFFASDAEAEHVVEALTPQLREVLAERGLVLLNWGHGGWAHIFSARAITSLDDLKSARLFTSSGDDGMVQWFKENGFNPVPLALTDVLMGLNTGLIDAYPSPPYGALVFQWYRQTSHMLDIPLNPVFGATVMTQAAWNRIGEADQAVLLEAAKETQDYLFEAAPRQDREAVAEMQKRGLTVTAVPPMLADFLRAEVDRLTSTWRGSRVPVEIYDAALAARSAFRSQ
ncbi:MAG: TRAP transporter substrate-binding protein DctP [Acidobacteria bacterium]|nr:TRAP transporter substrate-binding protein DctP [Acidobacteriota bacterium]